MHQILMRVVIHPARNRIGAKSQNSMARPTSHEPAMVATACGFECMVALLIRYETETSEWEMTWDVGFLIPVGCRSRRDELKSLRGRPEEDDQHAEHQPRCDNVGPYIFRPGRRRIQTVPQRSEKQHCAESADYPPNQTPAARSVNRLCSS